MKKFKRYIYTIFIVILAYLAYHYAAVRYGLEQAAGQLKIIWNTEEINSLRENPNAPDSLLAKFDLINAIRSFAEDSLGLTVGDNYTTFYDQKNKPILWTVTASPEFEIEAHQWEFPIAGSFPYKGFFNHKKALIEEDRLKKEGYDTKVGEVSAWSTLGILNDPVLSSMLKRSEGELAELIIHESTHATIYLKDQGKFNENLASFIGRKGAELFLIDQYGKNSEEQMAYLKQLEKSHVYKTYMQGAIEKLQLAYGKTDTSFSVEKRRKLKAQYISELKDGLKTTGYFENDSVAELRLKRFQPNNAYFSGFSTYADKHGIMEMKLKEDFNGNLKIMIEAVKTKGETLFNK